MYFHLFVGSGDICDNDKDNDGVINSMDNCPLVPNPDQNDADSDGQGDACENDDDGDTILNPDDNCPRNGGILRTDFRASQPIDLCMDRVREHT